MGGTFLRKALYGGLAYVCSLLTFALAHGPKPTDSPDPISYMLQTVVVAVFTGIIGVLSRMIRAGQPTP